MHMTAWMTASREARQAYIDALLTTGKVFEFIPGTDIPPGTYVVVTEVVGEYHTFEIKDFLECVIRFLARPTVKDSFESHHERVTWLNESGLASFGFAIDNKLRLNSIYGVRGHIKNFARSRRFAEDHPSIATIITEAFRALEDKQPFEEYGRLRTSERWAYAVEFERMTRTVMNVLIEHGLIKGPLL